MAVCRYEAFATEISKIVRQSREPRLQFDFFFVCLLNLVVDIDKVDVETELGHSSWPRLLFDVNLSTYFFLRASIMNFPIGSPYAVSIT